MTIMQYFTYAGAVGSAPIRSRPNYGEGPRICGRQGLGERQPLYVGIKLAIMVSLYEILGIFANCQPKVSCLSVLYARESTPILTPQSHWWISLKPPNLLRE